MFIESISSMAALAVEIVKYKYPKEFNDLNYGFLIFDLVEMVGDELAKKNMNLFIEPYIEQLANIKDISLGETFEFSVEQ